jgi:hypothetical protein
MVRYTTGEARTPTGEFYEPNLTTSARDLALRGPARRRSVGSPLSFTLEMDASKEASNRQEQNQQRLEGELRAGYGCSLTVVACN